MSHSQKIFNHYRKWNKPGWWRYRICCESHYEHLAGENAYYINSTLGSTIPVTLFIIFKIYNIVFFLIEELIICFFAVFNFNGLQQKTQEGIHETDGFYMHLASEQYWTWWKRVQRRNSGACLSTAARVLRSWKSPHQFSRYHCPISNTSMSSKWSFNSFNY